MVLGHNGRLGHRVVKHVILEECNHVVENVNHQNMEERNVME